MYYKQSENSKFYQHLNSYTRIKLMDICLKKGTVFGRTLIHADAYFDLFNVVKEFMMDWDLLKYLEIILTWLSEWQPRHVESQSQISLLESQDDSY